MSATRDGKMWRCQFYYKDWQGVSQSMQESREYWKKPCRGKGVLDETGI